MKKKLYVGGLSYDTTDESLLNLFTQAGEVASAAVITDRYSGRSRGFGFVEMAEEEGARKAIEELNGAELDGRNIIVAEARERSDRPRGGPRGRRY